MCKGNMCTKILNKEMGMVEAKPVSSPRDADLRGGDQDPQPLDEKMASKFRSIAARANYLAADRTDLMYSVKEICRGITKPTEKEWAKLKRFARYLSGCGKLVTTAAVDVEEKATMLMAPGHWRLTPDTTDIRKCVRDAGDKRFRDLHATTRDADAQVADMPCSRCTRGLATALDGAAIGVGAIASARRDDAR